MKALVYTGDKNVALRDVPLATSAENDVVVEVIRAGICGTDIGALAHGRPKLEPGIVLGHEFVGRRLDTGALVVGNPVIACHGCAACAAGRTHLCSNRKVLGVQRAGAFAERVMVPERNLYSAERLTPTQAALVDPLATALHAWRLADPSSERVAVLGAGAIGLCAVAVLKAVGVADIVVTDIVPARLEFAKALGATTVCSAPEGEFDSVIDAVGTEETRRNAVALLRQGGTAVLVGLHAAQLSLPAGPLIAGERTLRGAFAYTEAEFLEATSMAATLDTSWVRTIPFDAAAETLSAMVAGRPIGPEVKVHMQIAE
jgi:2-desacetyl-2-hydroxyethyl bacteriochlorophyllide A dehydrogenase